MTQKRNTNSFFKVGGPLEPNAPSYVTRQADQELMQIILSGQYCNILTARQMGKSSLMVRTVSGLKPQGIQTVVIDLTTVGIEVSASEWYFGIIRHFKQQLGLSLDEVAWWSARSQLSPVQRFSDFLRQVVLEGVEASVLIFVDEIDSTLSLPFTDDFFAAVRAAYNARASDPAYKRLTFVLLGAARPGDLIKDRSRTPYNIGLSIDLRDFTPEEARELLPGLEAVSGEQAETILERVLYWTGGHPYLTQKVCAAIAATDDDQWSNEKTDMLVKRLFLSDEARKESNLQYINDRIQESRDREKLLRTYQQVLSDKFVVDEERDPVKSQLKLDGLVKVAPQGALVVRNRIYETVFDRQWIKMMMPTLTSTRITVAAILIAVIALTISGVFIYRQQNSDEIQAQAYTEGFVNTQSPAVRITNLAGLFRLGGEYAVSGRSLFFGLDSDQQLAMFTELTAPEQVGEDLQLVVKGLYTHLEDEDHHNALLQTMADDLNKIEGAFPDSRILHGEIKAWLEGRKQADEGNVEEAIASYTRAIEYNDQNPAIYLDRALTYGRLDQHDKEQSHKALADLSRAIDLDPERKATVVSIIQSNPYLGDYLMSHQEDFPILVEAALQ
jgi:tetratricopeptide (TPR) repeat protein